MTNPTLTDIYVSVWRTGRATDDLPFAFWFSLHSLRYHGSAGLPLTFRRAACFHAIALLSVRERRQHVDKRVFVASVLCIVVVVCDGRDGQRLDVLSAAGRRIGGLGFFHAAHSEYSSSRLPRIFFAGGCVQENDLAAQRVVRERQRRAAETEGSCARDSSSRDFEPSDGVYMRPEPRNGQKTADHCRRSGRGRVAPTTRPASCLPLRVTLPARGSERAPKFRGGDLCRDYFFHRRTGGFIGKLGCTHAY